MAEKERQRFQSAVGSGVCSTVSEAAMVLRALSCKKSWMHRKSPVIGSQYGSCSSHLVFQLWFYNLDSTMTENVQLLLNIHHLDCTNCILSSHCSMSAMHDLCTRCLATDIFSYLQQFHNFSCE